MSDKTSVDRLIELAKDVTGLVEDNKEVIEGVLGEDGESRLVLTEKDILREVEVTGDIVNLTAEVKGVDVEQVGVKYKEGDLHIRLGDNVMVAEVPSDVIIRETEVNLNNGVLDVKVPRGDGVEEDE